MAVRIQLRRDSSENWTINNPILLSGEIGIEVDTLKFKIGNGSRWNSIHSYAFKPGEAHGLATLGSTGKLTVTQLPDQVSITADIAQAISVMTTSNIQEGSNKYFTEQRAINANADIIANAIINEANARNLQILNSKADTLSDAADDATSKANAAEESAYERATLYTDSQDILTIESAVALAADYTDSEINSVYIRGTDYSDLKKSEAIADSVSTASSYTDSEIIKESNNRNTAITSAINAITTSDIEEGSNKYFTEQRAKDALAGDLAALANGSLTLSSLTTDSLAEGEENLYFTNSRAIAATNNKFIDTIISVNESIDLLSLQVNGDIQSLQNSLESNYIQISNKNQPNGFAGIETDNTILESIIPLSIVRKNNSTLTGLATTENLTVTGNLTVNGTTTTVSSTNLEVTDPLIYIGTGNSANSKDLGLVAHFNNGTYQHSGLVRDASDGKWKLFSGITTEPSDIIDFTSWTKDTLVLGSLEATSATIGNISNTELQYLDGVTSSIQSQIDSKLSLSSASSTYATISSPTFTGTVSGITKSMVGLSNVDNTSDLLKPISNLTQTALNLKANLNNPTFTGTVDLSSATVIGIGSSLPNQSQNAGKYLTTDGTNASWATLDVSSFLTSADLSNTLSDYILEADRNQPNGFAGLNSSGYINMILIENNSIPNSKLINSKVTINGTDISLGDSITTTTYSNFNNSSTANKIGYGTSSSPNVTSPVAGDIYIQY